MTSGGLRAVAAGAPGNFRVFPDPNVGKARIRRRIGVHVPENCDETMHLPSNDVMKKYGDVGVSIVDWSEEVGECAE